MSRYTVNKTIEIKAAPAAVWDALTNPEKTKEYFFNCRVLSSWQAGSNITFKGRMFLIIPIEMSGTIVDIKPEKLLKYTLKNGKGGKATSTSTVTDTLSFENGITTVNITDDVGGGEGAEKRYKRSEKGWDKILGGLKKIVEKGNT